jgi:cell division protein FtsZ
MSDFAFESTPNDGPKLLVVGVGGGGGNAVKRMISESLGGVHYAVLNTDAQILQSMPHCDALQVLQIGKKVTRGLGAGARPQVGEKAAVESEEEIREIVKNYDMVFITCGMGGGTGTGASPMVARLAKAAGALVVGVVTKPFLFEGRKRMRAAEEGIAALSEHVDTWIVVENERLLAVVGRDTAFPVALARADEVLVSATRGVTEIMTVPGLVNVDFADCFTIMEGGGAAIMGTGESNEDESRRAIIAAQEALQSPLLSSNNLKSATRVLLNISGGDDITLGQVHTINEMVQEAVDPNAEIIFGAVTLPNMQGRIRVTVVATGFAEVASPLPASPDGVESRPAVGATPMHPTRPLAPSLPGSRMPMPPRPAAAPRPHVIAPQQNWGGARPPVGPTAAQQDSDEIDLELPVFVRGPAAQ